MVGADGREPPRPRGGRWPASIVSPHQQRTCRSGFRRPASRSGAVQQKCVMAKAEGNRRPLRDGEVACGPDNGVTHVAALRGVNKSGVQQLSYSPSDSGGSPSSSASSEPSSSSSGASGTAQGHSPAGPPAGSTTANTSSDDTTASGSTATSEGSNIGSVDTDPDPDTDTAPAKEPAEKPPAEKPDADIADAPTPFLPSGHRASPQAHPQADIKPTSDPETQSLSTSSTKTAHVGQPTADTGTTAKAVQSIQLDTSLATLAVDESQLMIAESAPEARESSTTAPQVVTGLLAARRSQPAGDRQPAGPGRAPADAVRSAGTGTPRDHEDLLQPGPHY
jgi:hypothetical protein